MPTSSQKPKRLRDDYRRALRLLAASPEGATESLLLAHGFKLELNAPLTPARHGC
jgi:hypothetical protein